MTAMLGGDLNGGSPMKTASYSPMHMHGGSPMKMDGSPIKTGRSTTGAENQPDVRILTGRMTAMLGELEGSGDSDERTPNATG